MLRFELVPESPHGQPGLRTDLQRQPCRTTGLPCAAPASTTSRTSTSISRATSLVVITGLSGSGKSSLAFDTIYAEGQRRYVESLSAYARQFLEQMEKPDVDLIEGLSPAISIEQKTTGSNPRSTVGTVTEIYDYLRLLFANIGVPHCPNCGREITSQSLERIVDLVMTYPQDTRINVMAPIVRGRKGEFKKELQALRARGFTKARIDGQLRSLEEDIKLDRRRNHTIEIVVDRLIVRAASSGGWPSRSRWRCSWPTTSSSSTRSTTAIGCSRGGWRAWSAASACRRCRRARSRSTRRTAPAPAARGWARPGISIPRASCPIESLSLAGGAIAPWAQGRSRLVHEAVAAMAAYFGIDPPTCRSASCRRSSATCCCHGPRNGRESRRRRAGRRSAAPRARSAETSKACCRISGGDSKKAAGRCRRSSSRIARCANAPCATANRLKAESLAVRVKGKTIADTSNLPIADALDGVRRARAHAIARR